MDWSQVTALTIPEGNVKQVSVNGVVLWKKAPSPSDYTQLEYIESTGTQRIDTNISGNARWVITAQATTIKGSSQVIISSTGGGGAGTWYGESTNSRVWGAGGTALSDIPPTTKTTADLTFNNSGITGTIGGISVVRDVTSNNSSWSIFATSSRLFPFTGKLFEATAYQNGTMVRNLIPAIRNNDSKVGMYDTVTKQFFTNAGTGEFIAGPRFVEYIEFDGNSWIDTGFKQQTCRIECGVEFINHNNNNAVQLMGFHVSTAGFWGIKFRGSMFYPYLNVNSYQYNDVILNLDTTDTKKPALTLTIGNATSPPAVGTTVISKTTYVMGGIKSGSTINYNNFMKVYYNRIYNANNELIQDLRPCLDPNNVACMYDMVTGTYFYNQGTGEFQYGGIL